MCLLTDNKFPRLTTKEIEVYKVVKVTGDGLISPYMRYGINETNTEPIFPLLSNYGAVRGGYIHSFTNFQSAMIEMDKLTRTKGGIYRVIKCIIPRFTFYFIGYYYNDICSKRLVIPNYSEVLSKLNKIYISSKYYVPIN